jgi:threonine dehydrogenase-like Zn-dependent dehydrogenase
MKAARLVGPRQFEFLDVEKPSPKPGEVLVKIEYASICGSDLLTYDKVFPEEDYPLRTGLPCHETSGVVEESMDESLKPGDRCNQDADFLRHRWFRSVSAFRIPGYRPNRQGNGSRIRRS